MKPILLVLVVSNQDDLDFFNILCAIGMFSIKIIIKVNHLDTSSIKSNVLYISEYIDRKLLASNYIHVTNVYLYLSMYLSPCACRHAALYQKGMCC